ncbi:DUF4087 domain-containing protein [Allorhizobium pseudoryzae]|uniref:DUF4087 domain-containing protein n=1 Tax=Allorhizobium pseudoryzae TaxID=379684 RepID=UPI003CFCCD8D
MQLKFLALALAVGTGLLAAPAMAENRCGWVQNPTPGNYWLDDRDGSWTILTQGSDLEPDGIDNMPDFSAGQFVQTNGYYGYACACMSVETDAAEMRITEIRSVKQLPLSKCKNDRTLPKPEG